MGDLQEQRAMYERAQEQGRTRISELEAERDALRSAVQAVREWAEELTRVPAMLDPLSLSAEYGRAVLALLAAARIEAGR